jgi:hypothetical protein
MDVILLITLLVLLFAALPTWPYSASGRSWFHTP